MSYGWNFDNLLPLYLALPTFYLSFLLVAKYIWTPMIRQAEAAEKLPPPLYKYRWLIDDYAEEKDQLEELMYCVMMAHTPNGPIFMRYNLDNEGFDYWSNVDMNYEDLNATARKYTLMYQCRNAYIYSEQKTTDVSNNTSLFDDDIFMKPPENKNKHLQMGNKFVFKGECYEAPFFEKKDDAKPFFCGGNVKGLDFKRFKESFLMK